MWSTDFQVGVGCDTLEFTADVTSCTSATHWGPVNTLSEKVEQLGRAISSANNTDSYYLAFQKLKFDHQ